MAQRRLLLGLPVVVAIWGPMSVYVYRVMGREVTMIFGALSVLGLCIYALFHRREEGLVREGEGARGEAGATRRLRGAAGVAASSPHRPAAGSPAAGSLPPAQIDFLWGLSALLLCGFLLLFIVVVPREDGVGAVLGLAAFTVLAAGVFVRLLRMTWPVLAVAGGEGLVKGALISSGVFMVGLGTASFIVLDSANDLLLSTPAEAPTAEVVRATPIRAPRPEPVTWPRPLPGAADLVEVGRGDLNLVSSGGVFERASAAVVTIRTATGHGTAFLITRDGLAITNEHVIEGSGPMVAVFRDGRERPIRVIRKSGAPDVALVQIACESDCATVEMAPPDGLDVGTEILVIGTPRAEILHHSMSRGIVSGLRYDMGVTAIQTDAAINGGNSGSPILEVGTGRVVGIVTSSLHGQDTEGIHFGIAIWDALRQLGIRLRP